MSSKAKDHRKRIEEFAQKNGWQVARTNNDHLVLTHPDCKTVFSSLTPSCPRVTLNTITKLNKAMRDAGFGGTVEEQPKKTYGNPFPHLPKTTNADRRERRAARLEAMARDI